MGWNHRVYRTRQRKTFPRGHRSDGTCYTIREVYYDKRGRPDGYTKDDIAPMGSNVHELRHELTMMLAATFKPVLNYKKERVTPVAKRGQG